MATLTIDERVLEQVEIDIARRLLAAAVVLSSEHKKNLNESNPRPYLTPAPKGTFPRKRTGGGQANVAYAPTSVAEVRKSWLVKVGVRLPGRHLAFLQRRGWKGVGNTAESIRGKLEAVVAGKK